MAAVFDYHDGGWPARVRDLAGGDGVAAAINAAPGGESVALSTVADGGRLVRVMSGQAVWTQFLDNALAWNGAGANADVLAIAP